MRKKIYVGYCYKCGRDLEATFCDHCQIEVEEQMAGRPAKQYKAGTILEKNYKGKEIKVRAGKDGTFQLKVDGKLHPKTFDSLSAAIMKVTGGKKYPASVFFGSSGTGKSGLKRGRKPKANGTEVQEGAPVGTQFDLNTLVQNAIADAVRSKVEEMFRS